MEFILLTACACPIIFTVINIINFKKNKKELKFEVVEFLIGIMLYFIAYNFLDGGNYEEKLYKGIGTPFHEAINFDFSLSIYFTALVGLIAYFILKYKEKRLPPLIEAILLAAVYIEIVLIAVLMVQFLPVFSCISGSDFGYFLIGMGIYLFLINFEMFMVNLVYLRIQEQTSMQSEKEYKNKFLACINNILCKKHNIEIFAIIIMFPLLAIIILILTLCGQTPDGFIKAFTETSDWMLSTKTSPPPIEYHGHYLCTVSLRGHKKLVKPIRYGIRNNKKIVVNRQLCVANAFEDLIMERFPRFHKWIRYVYDKYGYPISKFIKKPLVADIVYLIMKPLEWIFLIVLYTFDVKPENRIARQYMPGLRNYKN